MIYDVLVIGAGPAGLLAAIKAAEDGAKVLLLEKMEKPARKLRITGKGRCNITNMKLEEAFLKHIHPQAKFLKPAFKNFNNTALVAFLNKIGLPTVDERGDRVFPLSQKAWDVADVLHKHALNLGVEIQCKTEVIKFELNQNSIVAVQCVHQQKDIIFHAHSFIIATGGLSYPKTGCTGQGYLMAQQCGHTIVPTRPSLTALEIENLDQGLAELGLKNCGLSLIVDGGCVQYELGELLFTEWGIDGPNTLRISRKAVDALIASKKVRVQLDLKPALDVKQLEKRVEREIDNTPKFNLKQLLETLLPKQFVAPFAFQAKLDLGRKVIQLNNKDKSKLIQLLKCYPLTINGYRPFAEAIVTAGGVNLQEINPKTLQSKIMNNLFFSGELIDLDGDTGGYNLQIAFSTGYLAGLHAAKYSGLNKLQEISG